MCHNERDPGAKRPSCGESAGLELRRWLRDRARAEDLKADVLCARSGCLDVCSGRGTTVALVPADARPTRLIVVGAGDREALWQEIRAAVAPDDGRSPTAR